MNGSTTKRTEIMMKEFRFLLALTEIPINYYSWSSGRIDLINSVFNYISNDSNPAEVFDYFSKNIKFLKVFKKHFDKANFTANYLVYEVLFWSIAIIKKSGLDINKLETNAEQIANSIINCNEEVFRIEQSHYYTNVIKRYTFLSEQLNKIYNTNFDAYITSSEYSKAKIKLARDAYSLIKSSEYLNYIKKEPINITIKALQTKIKNNAICLRPEYQREESMNVQKASSLIESIILGCKIAPIYLYTRLDGTTEVLDGQQRLLAILGFLNISYKNARGEEEASNKTNFKLTGLKYLKELNNTNFNSLPEDIKYDIEHFSLSIIELREENMKHFDPVDLFIRLNNKPYPIKEHSFEMWNAIAPVSITQKIKEIARENSEWFYLRTNQNNKRMQNEEMITNLLYLEVLRQRNKNVQKDARVDMFQIYAKSTHLACMLKNKKFITDFLLSVNQTEFDDYANSLNKFINKLRIVLYSEDLTLKKRLQDLICPEGGKRTLQTIFLLFYIFSPVSDATVKEKQDEIYNNIAGIILYFKQKYVEEDKETHLTEFKEMINKFWNMYSTGK